MDDWTINLTVEERTDDQGSHVSDESCPYEGWQGPWRWKDWETLSDAAPPGLQADEHSVCSADESFDMSSSDEELAESRHTRYDYRKTIFDDYDLDGEGVSTTAPND